MANFESFLFANFAVITTPLPFHSSVANPVSTSVARSAIQKTKDSALRRLVSVAASSATPKQDAKNTKPSAMKTEYIFYTVGIIFAIATILYFTWEYLFELARSLKVTALVLLTLFFWFLGSYLRERDW